MCLKFVTYFFKTVTISSVVDSGLSNTLSKSVFTSSKEIEISFVLIKPKELY